MGRQGFHRWAWLVVFLLGGLLMLYGGAQDVTLFFSPEGDLAPVPSWHPVSPVEGLVCGLIVLASAGLNVVWGWRLRRAEGAKEQRLARWVALVSGVAMIADWVSGYYGFGSLMALLTGIWLMMKHPSEETTARSRARCSVSSTSSGDKPLPCTDRPGQCRPEPAAAGSHQEKMFHGLWAPAQVRISRRPKPANHNHTKSQQTQFGTYEGQPPRYEGMTTQFLYVSMRDGVKLD